MSRGPVLSVFIPLASSRMYVLRVGGHSEKVGLNNECGEEI